MLNSLQKLIPWFSRMPVLPKIGITVIMVLIGFIFLYLIWVPPPTALAEDQPRVRQAYDRMKRVLSRLGYSQSGTITVDGTPVEDRLVEYYSNYSAISDYIASAPGDIKGAYENVWDHGGAGRVFIDDTQAFETVVSAFFREYHRAENPQEHVGDVREP